MYAGEGSCAELEEEREMKHIVVILMCLVMVACATGPGGKTSSKQTKGSNNASQQEALPRTEINPRVTIEMGPSTVADVAHAFSENIGGSLVFMSGIENRALPALSFKRQDYRKAVQEIAAVANCRAQETPYYCFVYPESHEPLTSVSLEGMLDPAFNSISVAVSLGFDTPLFEVFALMSRALGITVVADQVVGDARSGSLTLAQIPLPNAIEAILKSARAPQEAFQIESTPEYILIMSRANPTTRDTILNPDELDDAGKAKLDAVVNVVLPELPEEGDTMHVPPGASLLPDVLPHLSRQLGIEVTALAGLEDVPVMPCVLNKVRVRTAMDLLIRQWPVPKFGYRFAEGKITIEVKP